MKQPVFLSADPAREYFTDERCHILELSNHAGDAGVSIARARVEPGVTTRWHRVRDTVERYVILEGRGAAEIGAEPARTVEPGDVVVIPAGCRQRIRNVGDRDLVFLCVCSPRFEWPNYEALD